ISDAVAVLNCDDFHYADRLLDLRDADFRKTDVLDLALSLQFLERSKLFVGRDRGIDTMQLKQIDAIDAKSPQASFTGRAQVFGPAVLLPPARPRPHKPRFRSDHQTRRVRMQRFGYQAVADFGTIRIRGVDEGDSELNGSSPHPDRFCGTALPAPEVRAGQPL